MNSKAKLLEIICRSIETGTSGSWNIGTDEAENGSMSVRINHLGDFSARISMHGVSGYTELSFWQTRKLNRVLRKARKTALKISRQQTKKHTEAAADAMIMQFLKK